MMTPSAAATPRRRRRRCNASVSARALAAGLWRLRHAQRMKKAVSGTDQRTEEESKPEPAVPLPCQQMQKALPM
nr:unnamed protein product [Digitaria exilis]